MQRKPNESAEPLPKRRGKPRRLRKQLPDRLIVPLEAEEYIVLSDQAGLRLDQFLKMRLRWRSRQKVQELIELRDVTANGLRVDRAYRVKLGEKIRFPLPPPPEAAYKIAEIPLNILYEDDQFVIVNKQPNLVVHPVGKHLYDTLINALHLRYRRLDDPKADVIVKLAHRIDRETSGVLLALKTTRENRVVPLVFEKGGVVKEYLTLVEGGVKDDSGVIDFPLEREPSQDPEYADMAVAETGGLVSKTGFEVVERFAHFTLVRARLFTGRMHQIRVHMRAIGHPVVCDKTYGTRDILRLSEARPLRDGEEDRAILSRQALHSWRLTFRHPQTRKEMTVEAPLPDDMAQTLEALRGK